MAPADDDAVALPQALDRGLQELKIGLLIQEVDLLGGDVLAVDQRRGHLIRKL